MTTRGRFSNPEKKGNEKVDEENKSFSLLFSFSLLLVIQEEEVLEEENCTFNSSCFSHFPLFPRQREENCCHELLSLPLDSTGLLIFPLSRESNEIFILRRLGLKTKMLPNKSSSQRLCSLSYFISRLGLRKTLKEEFPTMEMRLGL